LAEIKQSLPGVELVILTCHYSAPLLQAIVQSGALGFVLKSDTDRDLIAAVESVRRREAYISRHVDALLPTSSKTTPLVMLLAESGLLTEEERAQVRLITKANAASALTIVKTKPDVESSLRTPLFPRGKSCNPPS